MPESPITPPQASPRLDSWKEIAAFFGKDVRTVRRWEAERNLPIHRLPGSDERPNRASVYAFTAELEAWLRESPAGESLDESPEEAVPAAAILSPPTAPPPPTRRYLLMAFGALLILSLLAIAIWHRHKVRQLTADLASRPAVDPQSQDLYLRGRYLWNLRTEASLNQAVDVFTQSIVRDPKFAPAYAGLADCYLLLRQYGNMPESEAFPRAYAASRHAIALDNSSAEAHRSYAFVLNNWLWNFPAAEVEFKQALLLDPTDAQTHHWYATSLYSVGRYQDALREIDAARALRPESAVILINRTLLLEAIDRDVALIAVTEVEQANPNLAYVHRASARIHLRLKQYEAFLDESRQNATLSHRPLEVAVIEQASRQLKDHGPQAMFISLASGYANLTGDNRGQSAMEAALFCAQIKDTDRVLHFLNLSADRHESDFHSLSTFPEFDFLQANPSFQALFTRSQTPFPPPAA